MRGFLILELQSSFNRLQTIGLEHLTYELMSLLRSYSDAFRVNISVSAISNNQFGNHFLFKL